MFSLIAGAPVGSLLFPAGWVARSHFYAAPLGLATPEEPYSRA